MATKEEKQKLEEYLDQKITHYSGSSSMKSIHEAVHDGRFAEDLEEMKDKILNDILAGEEP